MRTSAHQLLNNTVILVGCNKDNQGADGLFPIIKERMPSYLILWVNFFGSRRQQLKHHYEINADFERKT